MGLAVSRRVPERKGFSVTPFISTVYSLQFQPDNMEWFMNKLILETSVVLAMGMADGTGVLATKHEFDRKYGPNSCVCQ
jgi:hypothetical protein